MSILPSFVTLPPFTLIGVRTRTTNEQSIQSGQKPLLSAISDFYANSSNVLNRSEPGVLLTAIYEYDFLYKTDTLHGEYSIFVGEKINEIQNLSPKFQTLYIPAQTYLKFTSIGRVEVAVAHTWQERIWKNKILQKKRSYTFDFDVYDQKKTEDKENAFVETFLSIKDTSEIVLENL